MHDEDGCARTMDTSLWQLGDSSLWIPMLDGLDPHWIWKPQSWSIICGNPDCVSLKFHNVSASGTRHSNSWNCLSRVRVMLSRATRRWFSRAQNHYTASQYEYDSAWLRTWSIRAPFCRQNRSERFWFFLCSRVFPHGQHLTDFSEVSFGANPGGMIQFEW